MDDYSPAPSPLAGKVMRADQPEKPDPLKRNPSFISEAGETQANGSAGAVAARIDSGGISLGTSKATVGGLSRAE